MSAFATPFPFVASTTRPFSTRPRGSLTVCLTFPRCFGNIDLEPGGGSASASMLIGACVQLELARDQVLDPKSAVLIGLDHDSVMDDDRLCRGLLVPLEHHPADQDVVGRLGGESKLARVNWRTSFFRFAVPYRPRNDVGLRLI